MTNRYLISRFVGKILLMPLMPALMVLGLVACVAIIVLTIPICIIGYAVASLFYFNLPKEAWYRLTRWVTYRYSPGDGGWMARKSPIDRDWLIVNDNLYIGHAEAVKVIKREAADIMRTQHGGCTLAIRIYHSEKTHLVKEVNFRIERDGEPVACHLSDRAMSRIEHQIHRLPTEGNHTDRFSEYDEDEIRMTF